MNFTELALIQQCAFGRCERRRDENSAGRGDEARPLFRVFGLRIRTPDCITRLASISRNEVIAGMFENGALRIGARFVVRTSSILNRHVRFLRSLRRRDVFAWGGFIAIEPRVLPEPERDWKRIYVEFLPPGGLITRAMKLAVMDPANRDGELVADSVSKRTRLGKREMMRVRRRPAAARHTCRDTNFRCSLSRRRTVLPKARTALLLTGLPDTLEVFRLSPASGRPAGITFRPETALDGSLGPSPSPMVESLARNPSSTIRASAAVSVFLVERF
jgi:hypothetical protein